MFQNITVGDTQQIICESVAACKDLAFSVSVATKQGKSYKVSSSIKHLFDYTSDSDFDFISFVAFFIRSHLSFISPVFYP